MGVRGHLRARYGMGPGEGREQASHCQAKGEVEEGAESSFRSFLEFLVLPFPSCVILSVIFHLLESVFSSVKWG